MPVGEEFCLFEATIPDPPADFTVHKLAAAIDFAAGFTSIYDEVFNLERL